MHTHHFTHMKNKASTTKVTYLKGSVRYSHVFPENISGAEAERRMILEKHVGRSDIIMIEHK